MPWAAPVTTANFILEDSDRFQVTRIHRETPSADIMKITSGLPSGAPFPPLLTLYALQRTCNSIKEEVQKHGDQRKPLKRASKNPQDCVRGRPLAAQMRHRHLHHGSAFGSTKPISGKPVLMRFGQRHRGRVRLSGGSS